MRVSRDDLLQKYADLGKGWTLLAAVLLVGAIALLRPASGAWYLIPALLAAGNLSRWESVTFSLACALLSAYQPEA
jgi:hypothetical protein